MAIVTLDSLKQSHQYQDTPNIPTNPRQIRYNMKSEGSYLDLPCSWTFFILNTRTKGAKIAQRIVNYFSSLNSYSQCAERYELETETPIAKDSLIGRLLTLRSNVTKMEEAHRNKIYHTNKWHKDERLKAMDLESLEIYFENILPKRYKLN